MGGRLIARKKSVRATGDLKAVCPKANKGGLGHARSGHVMRHQKICELADRENHGLNLTSPVYLSLETY